MEFQETNECPNGTTKLPGQMCSKRTLTPASDAPKNKSIESKIIISPIETAIAKARSNAMETARQRTPTFTPRPLKIVSKLTPTQIENAKLVAISYQVEARLEQLRANNLSEAFLDGTEFLKMNGLDGWSMNDLLSTRDFVVVSKNNETKIVFRGRSGDSDNTT